MPSLLVTEGNNEEEEVHEDVSFNESLEDTEKLLQEFDQLKQMSIDNPEYVHSSTKLDTSSHSFVYQGLF